MSDLSFRDCCNAIILATMDPKQVNQVTWASGYARAGAIMTQPDEIKLQCLYILNNITHWRGPQAKEVRARLKELSK